MLPGTCTRASMRRLRARGSPTLPSTKPSCRALPSGNSWIGCAFTQRSTYATTGVHSAKYRVAITKSPASRLPIACTRRRTCSTSQSNVCGRTNALYIEHCQQHFNRLTVLHLRIDNGMYLC